MTHTLQTASPLRQRMIDDMRMRQLAPKTQANYLRIVWGVTNAQRQPAKPNCDRSVKAGP